jgi:phosphocarrier protein
MAVAEGAQEITEEVGLHARPAVKLTQTAARYGSAIQVRVGDDGDWIDAKSVVKVMRLKARTGKTLHFHAEGDDAEAAVAALRALVERGFADAE